MQVRRIYCEDCHHHRDCIKVGRESVGESFGGARWLGAIVTLGLSEAMTEKEYWKCTKCGKIIGRGS